MKYQDPIKTFLKKGFKMSYFQKFWRKAGVIKTFLYMRCYGIMRYSAKYAINLHTSLQNKYKNKNMITYNLFDFSHV